MSDKPDHLETIVDLDRRVAVLEEQKRELLAACRDAGKWIVDCGVPIRRREKIQKTLVEAIQNAECDQ